MPTNWTTEQKEDIILLLKDCNWGIGETMTKLKDRKISITRQTLHKWKRETMKRDADMSLINKHAVINTKDKIVLSEEEVSIDKEIANMILNRMRELIPKERNLNALSATLRAINEMGEKKPDTPKGLTLIQQVYNKIQENNEISKNRTQGNIQDVTPVSE